MEEAVQKKCPEKKNEREKKRETNSSNQRL